MPARPVRSFFATMVVLGSALPGVVGASASAAPAAPVDPGGGCWRYVPNPTPDPDAGIDDVDRITDVSTQLEAWGEKPSMTLDTAGDTAVGGVRTFTLKTSEGPAALAPLPVGPRLPVVTALKGTATFFFDVVTPDTKRAELDPIEVEFTVPAGGDAIPALEAGGKLPLAMAGASALILRSVYFDLPDLKQRLACNGQTVVDATSSTNPATTPLDTSVQANMTTLAAPGLGVARVVGQDVVDAARGGDEVQATLTGFASDAQVPLTLCGPSADTAPACGSPVDVTTLADGSATSAFIVPADAPTGAGSIRVSSKVGTSEVVLDRPLRVLAAPTVELGETSAKNRIRAVGDEWDPLRQVSLIAVDDSGTRVGRTVRVTAASTGRIDARLTIPADADVTGVVAEQEHRGEKLRATVDVPAAGGSDAGTGSGSGNDAGTGAGAGSGSSAAPVSPPETLPVDIPAPTDLPVTTVADPQAAGAPGAQSLAVTKVSLTGSTRFGDLLGGGPDRVLKLRVENVGTTEVVAPGLSISVGKGQKIEPVYTSDGFARLAAGKSMTIKIPIGLPAGAFGVYTISGQVGEGASGAFSTTWETYPWGLFVLNALGVLLIAFAVRRRVFAPAPSRIAALAGPPRAASGGTPDAGAAVIDLEVLERWWALQADSDGVRVDARGDTTADAVVDVEAVERWLERCSARHAEIDGISAKSTSSVN